MALLSVANLTRRFGGVVAVDDVSFDVREGEIVGLIGPNGAGKTTLFNVIAGRLKPTSGRVLMDGEDITGLEPHQLFAKGLLRTFQIAHEFASMTVRENLMMVPGHQSGEVLWNYQRQDAAECVRYLPGLAGFSNDITLRPVHGPSAASLRGAP